MAWVPDVLDPDEDQTREVYAHAGLALYCAQVLEHGLANVVIFARAGGPGFPSTEDYDRVLDELLSKTMGAQIHETLKAVKLTDEQIDALQVALRLRNFLVHNFFRERIASLLTVDGRNRLIAELDEIRDKLHEIDVEVQELTYRYAEAHGITREMWQAAVAQQKVEALRAGS
jgi:hypothetical protein